MIVFPCSDRNDIRFVGDQILGLGGCLALRQDATGQFKALVEPLGLSEASLALLLSWAEEIGFWYCEACDPGPAGGVAETLCRLAAGLDPGGLATRTLRGIGAK